MTHLWGTLLQNLTQSDTINIWTSDKDWGGGALCVVKTTIHLVSWARSLNKRAEWMLCSWGSAEWQCHPAARDIRPALFPTGVRLLKMHGRPCPHMHACMVICMRTHAHTKPPTYTLLSIEWQTSNVWLWLRGRGGINSTEVASCRSCANLDLKSWRKMSKFTKRLNAGKSRAK